MKGVFFALVLSIFTIYASASSMSTAPGGGWISRIGLASPLNSLQKHFGRPSTNKQRPPSAPTKQSGEEYSEGREQGELTYLEYAKLYAKNIFFGTVSFIKWVLNMLWSALVAILSAVLGVKVIGWELFLLFLTIVAVSILAYN